MKLNISLFAILIYMLFSSFSTTVIVHKRGHINYQQSLTNVTENKIGIIFPDSSDKIYYYNATKDVIEETKNILKDRKSGSEVFVLFKYSTIWDIDICHEHNGVVIECGEEL